MPWEPLRDLAGASDLVAPAACAGCRRAGQQWCGACQSLLAASEPGRWSPTPAPLGLPPTWTGVGYTGAIQSAIVAWKDEGRADLTAVFAPLLRRVLATALLESPSHRAALRSGTPPVLLVPAPSARSSTRERGEHRVSALLRAACPAVSSTQLVAGSALVLGGRVADQSRLTAEQRQANLAGLVRVPPRLRRRIWAAPCVIVDDVITTGSTITECARALGAAGAGQIAAITLAATQRRRPGQGR